MALADRAELAVRLTLDDRAFTGGLRRSQSALGKFGSSAGRVGRGVGQIGAGLARAGLLAGGAAVAGLTAAAKAASDFEAELRTINTIARQDAEGLTQIGDGIRELARQGRGELSDLAEGFYDILSAGITDTAQAQQVLTSATTLAIGGLSTNAQAVDLLTTAINAYGQEASEAQADADLFAKAIELGKVTADEIAASFANVAPIAAQQKIEIEEVAAAYAALTAQGVPAAEVTTQMQRAIVELLSPNEDLIALQKELGVSFLEIAQDQGLVVALQQMRDAVNGDEEAFKALFGRVEGYKFALQTTGPQQQIYNDALTAMGDAAGTASAQMAERQQGLAFAVNRLKANLVDAGITLATGFLPALTRVADKLSEFLGDAGNRSQLARFGEDIGRAIDGIDWGKVESGAREFVSVLKLAADFALATLGALNALPTEIKAAGLGFIGLNKLSGGLLGAGVGNIVGGLAGGLSNALIRAGVGKAFVQPVFVTNPGFGGLGGRGVAPPPIVPGAAAGAAAAGAGNFSLSALAAGAAPLTIAAFAPLALFELTKAIIGGDEKIIENFRVSQQTTAAARGLDPAQVPTNPVPPRIAAAVSDPIVAAINAQRHDPIPIKGFDYVAARQQAQFERLRERTEANRIAIVTTNERVRAKLDTVTLAQRQTKIGIQQKLDAARASAVANTSRLQSTIRSSVPIVNVTVTGLVNTVVKTGTTIQEQRGLTKANQAGA